ncbi:hypothetical protein BO70DRAFT_360838 [Aspergillus heteromorphus CBS 117.55]|uniref:Uncharacterized protein n=1 Tax=Aspergillus heteromorphus CBS 117.55 TaxID=1448321 RepID=A0A317WL44_9EURO|nr:uncharacterized protein BO70DRAFT_360838 [Aspergillus heteromorphus CBS 117.55]PWY86032.1 hypothetical protein BO70DRAFT_360838 [Aspergillus heteromorphus CBS 117.55]
MNPFGEELITVGPDYEWYRPNNTYGDQLLPQPPLRLKSRAQFEQDRIFGYPPRMGERNLPRETHMPFMYENVDEVRATIRAREEAKRRGIIIDLWMASAEIVALIAQHDEKHGSIKPREAKETKELTRKRRRGEAAEPTQVKRRRKGKEATPPPEEEEEGRKTLRIKLTLKGNNKRSHSEIEEVEESTDSKETDTKAIEDGPSPSKILKLSGLPRNHHTLKGISTPTASKAEPKKEPVQAASTEILATGAPEAGPSDQSLGETPGGRPRRRAAAALMAEFENHAQERARRAHARKKGSDKPDDPDDNHPH